MQKMIVLLACVFISFSSFAKIWRVNNNAGVVADFTTFQAVMQSSAVVAGDTIHIEPSAITYATGNLTLSKRLVVIGAGYFLNPSDATYVGNSGLQFTVLSSALSYIGIDAGAAGSKFMGLALSGIAIYASTTPLNLTFEKVAMLNNQFSFYSNGANNNSDNVTFRKCYFYNGTITTNGSVPTVSNLTIENCVFYPGGTLGLNTLTGSGNVIRNNSWYSSNAGIAISNAYVANNIFDVTAACTFTNCTVKNNLFKIAQALPGTAVGNQINANMTNVYVGGGGSLDSRAALKTGSPAIGAGVTIASYTPDAGAFGGPDPYKLSGIPPVPSIYSLSVPTSIPTGTATMNVTFSSRNNN